MRLVLHLALVPMLLLAACGGTDDGEATGDAGETPPSTTAPAPTSTTSTTTEAPPTTAPPTTAASGEEPSCRVLDDPVEGERSGWVVVNDGVMGGRSEGQVTLVEDALVFDGEIVTDGGGFSSIRTDLPEGALDGADRIVVRARTDGRDYLLTARDVAPERGRRTSFQAPIPFGSEPGVQEVEVLLDDLAPVVFGEPVDDAPFARELAVEIGVQLSDGLDGPFRLELDALLVCDA